MLALLTSLYGASGRVRRRRARAEHDLARRGGPRLRQAQGARHRLDARGARARARHRRARVPRRRAVGVRLQPDRARGHDGRGLALRALAGGAAGDDPDLRGRLLRGAQRGDPPLPVDHPGRGVRRAGVAAGLGRVLHLRLELRLLPGDLRRVRGAP